MAGRAPATRSSRRPTLEAEHDQLQCGAGTEEVVPIPTIRRLVAAVVNFAARTDRNRYESAVAEA